ncbi:MAG: hypothetical protein MZV70_71170 [Desulfobacterales bacterium]|nr:hypothetical protein [Desulfobacterales bacterium]
MLVLLVIFMVTAPMMQSGIGVNLPHGRDRHQAGRGGPDADRDQGPVRPHRRLRSSTSTSSSAA